MAHATHPQAFSLQQLIEDLERIAGLGIAFHNVGGVPRISAGDDGRVLEPSRNHKCNFCETVKSTDAGMAACMACDARDGNKRAGQERRTFKWRCHAGLEEVLVPVLLEDRHAGTLFGGQARPAKLREAQRRRIEAHWRKLGLNVDKLRTLYAARPVHDGKNLDALGRLLAALAERVAQRAATAALTRAYEAEKDTPVKQALALMAQHVAKPLSLSEIAKRVHLSPSRLSHLFTQREGASFRECLLKLRIERAKELLSGTPLPVAEVAARVGYEDPNFFSRIFSKKTGHAPRAYRRQFARA